ncbi:vitellogenin-1-like [Trichomycterus rosablanca]|uniref:vitellogenin-1-like n=1 Tax=Trichomycterus rosablanca TaxID=2290929 RepID=UPI002F35594B
MPLSLTVRVLTQLPTVLSSSAKPLGYEAAAYYTPGSQKDDVELIVSEVAEEANWKICVDGSIDKIQTAAKTHFKWGAECQSYEVAAKLSATGVIRSTATVTAEMNWGEVPAFIQMMGKSVREYLPGLSYAWGFNQKHEKNIEREISATLLASAHEGFDLKVKVPELTVHRQGIPSPFEMMGIEITEESV